MAWVYACVCVVVVCLFIEWIEKYCICSGKNLICTLTMMNYVFVYSNQKVKCRIKAFVLCYTHNCCPFGFKCILHVYCVVKHFAILAIFRTSLCISLSLHGKWNWRQNMSNVQFGCVWAFRNISWIIFGPKIRMGNRVSTYIYTEYHDLMTMFTTLNRIFEVNSVCFLRIWQSTERQQHTYATIYIHQNNVHTYIYIYIYWILSKVNHSLERKWNMK